MKELSLHSIGRISKNSFFLLSARFIDTLVRLFIIIPIVARYLGVERYGDYGYVMVFAFIVSTVTYVGIERITIREISKDPDQAGRYLGGSLIVRWFYMTVVIALITIFVWFMNLSYEVVLSIYIAIFALNFAADTLIYLGMFKAFEKMGYETLLTAIFQFLNLGFILSISYFNLGFVALFVGLLIANLMKTILAIVITCKKFVKPDFKINLSLIKLLLRESYILTLFGLVIHLFINVDILILKAIKDSFEVSMFYAPHSLIVLMSLIPMSLMSGLFPTFSRSAETDVQSLFFKYEKAFKILAILSIFLTTLCIVFSHKIVLIIYGKEFLSAVRSFRILAVSNVFIMLFAVFDFTLVAVNRQNSLILCPLIGVVIKTILDVLLIPDYGYTGACIAAVIGYFVLFSMGFFFTSKYVIALPLSRLILKPVLAALLIGLCLSLFNQGNIYIVSLLSLLGFLSYGLCLFWLGYFLPEDIVIFKTIMQKAKCVISAR